MLTNLWTDRALRRSVWVAGVLIAEYLALFVALAVAFDGDAIAALPGVWQFALSHATSVLGGAILGVGAAVAIWGDRLVALLDSVELPEDWSLRWFLVHILAYLVFAALSFVFLGRPDVAAAGGVVLLLVWIGLGLGLTFALLRAAYGSALGTLLRRLGGIALAAGACGGLTAVVLMLVLPYWTLLAGPTLAATAGLLHLVFDGVMVDPAERLIGLESFVVRVDSTCSGIEGMALVGLFLSGYLLRFRAEHRFPQALLIVPLGILLSFVANTLRIALLIVVGAYVNPEIASGAFHSMAGWIFFCFLTIGLVVLSRRVAWFHRIDAGDAEDVVTDNPTAAFLLPFLAWLAIGMVTSAMVLTLDAFYPLRVVVVGAILLFLRHQYAPALPRPAFDRSGPLVTASPWLIGLAIFVIWIALSPMPEEGPRSIADVLAETGWAWGFLLAWIVFRVIGTVIIVPVIEELAFRGYLQRRLAAADFSAIPLAPSGWLPVLVSAVVFGLMHANWVAGVIAGLGFSLAMAVRGRLSDAIIAHAVANLAISVLALGYGRWDLW